MLRSELTRYVNEAAGEITKENTAVIEEEIKAAFKDKHINEMPEQEANARLIACCMGISTKLSGAVAARLMQKLGLLSVTDE